MSSESVGANEFPDIAGVKPAQPENPSLANFRPYIPANVQMRELTALPLIIGTLLGMIFGASSLWLVLKVGLTVSASIPVAVISISLFRLLGKIGVRDATILENNIVQTAGSAGESIAFGVGVTMPAIMILGFRPGVHARHARCGDGWTTRHPDDDSATSCTHRATARLSEVPRRHCLR